MSTYSLPSRAELRQEARARLSGNWGKAILVCVITLLISLILNRITGILAPILTLLIAGPLAVGGAKFFLAIARARGPQASISLLFDGFSNYLKTVGLYVVMGIFVLLWSLLLIVPGIIAAYRYSQAYYILSDEPEIGIMEAINRSKTLMVGHKWELFVLQLSFIGWALLCIITLGIGFLWLAPYSATTSAVYYLHLSGESRQAPPTDWQPPADTYFDPH